MSPSAAELAWIRTELFTLHGGIAGVMNAARTGKLVISETSIRLYFKGERPSRRTLDCIARLLHTAPAALLVQARLACPLDDPAAQADTASVRLHDPEAFRVAYQLWVEMGTRKLGEPIDPATDLIGEVYDSWYAFFKIARELAKAIPLHKDPADLALRRLVQLSQAVLNHGLRPHLQRWQGKFRAWHTAGDRALAPGLTPQAAQALFPEWAALRDDLAATGQRLMTYHAALGEMIARPNAPQPPAASKNNAS